MSGYYIALEGIDGCGKSTQAKLLAAAFRVAFPKLEVFETREPGMSSHGQLLRSIAINRGNQAPNVRALALALDRALNIQENILPALERGALVISDRCYLSSLVYQACAEDLDTDQIFETIKLAIGTCDPYLILWLDTPPHLALQRLSSKTPDYFEAKGLDFLRVLQANYANLHPRMPSVVRVPCTDDLVANQAAIFKIAQAKLNQDVYYKVGDLHFSVED